MRVSPRIIVCAMLAAGWLAVVAAQDGAPATQYPALVSDVSAPAIDRGLRTSDPPREPRKELAGPRFVAGEPYLRGSIIVKFRPGTGPEAERAMLARVQGATTRALSYTDFNLVAIDPAADPEAAARTLEAQPDV